MSEKYDVIIIGAGIGGLVCGCYLAKSGLNVLIVEQHYKPGGYCTSFDRKGYRFDVGVHYLGSLREEGVLFRILKDFELLDRIKFITNDPTDRIITPGRTVFIRKDKNKTREELIAHFHDEEENINNFFSFILKNDFATIVAKTKKKTFKELLDTFFQNPELKAVLTIPLGNLGLSASCASALVSTVLYEEYIFDGGYYPQGGIQVFPDLLACRFKEYGGELLLSTKATKIITHQRKVCAVKLEKGEVISTKYVVSNADASLTFKNLLDSEAEESKIITQLQTSISAFVVYLGLTTQLNINPKHFTTWFFSTNDIEKCYSKQIDFSDLPNFEYELFTFSSLIDPSLCPQTKSIVRILTGARYAEKDKWDNNKEVVCDELIKQADKIIGEIGKHIEVKIIATPYTFYHFTSNNQGALFGWASIPSQIDRNIFPPETSIENLYLAGHWVTTGVAQSGVPVVALCGKNTAEIIIRKIPIG